MELTEKLETVKGMLKSSLREEIQWYHQAKFLSMVVSKKKRGCRARSKTRHMLGENFHEATPSPKDSGLPVIE